MDRGEMRRRLGRVEGQVRGIQRMVDPTVTRDPEQVRPDALTRLHTALTRLLRIRGSCGPTARSTARTGIDRIARSFP